MSRCPICTTRATTKREGSPFWICPKCACWFQYPFPPKVFIGEHEYPLAMGDGEKRVNEALAAHLFDNVMRGNPGRTLDIGAQWPYLASRLIRRGCAAIAIDGDAKVDGWSGPLGVPLLRANFEAEPDEHLAFCLTPRNFALITLIHSWEHLYNPLASLRKLRQYIADDGRVFIRMPDHSVRGFERDLIPSHYLIHPFFHSFSSILEALVQVRDCFVVESVHHMDGHGQSDIVLRPIKRAQTLAVGIIAKNEARDLPRALKSVDSVIDQGFGGHTFVVDTGSTDATVEIARRWGAQVRTFTDASVQSASGEWLLQDFSAARNEVIADADKSDATHFMWLDADDELLTPDVVRRLLYWHQYDCFGAMCEQAGDSWVHYRLWRLELGIRFAGRIHEYAVLDNFKTLAIKEFRIRHDATPSPTGEDANARNLRILQTDFAENPTTRGAFYLGGTHRDAGRHELAAQWFLKRIEMGVGYRDEMLFAYLYAARALRNLELWGQADDLAYHGGLIEPTWAEFRMERSMIAYKRGDYAAAIDFAAAALNMPIPPTQLWREVPMYTDQPLRMLSWCHEHLGNMAQSLTWAREAKARIIGDDAEWDKRIARLESLQPTNAPAVHAPNMGRPIIGLCRPGAIGDILMTLNLIPALKEANPDHDIAYFCDRRLGAMNALGSTMHAAGVDMILDCAGWERWHRTFDRAINLVGYPLAEGYPYKPMRHHLLQYFGYEMGLYGKLLHWEPSPILHSLSLRRPERTAKMPRGDYATLQFKAGWSKYKQHPRLWPDVANACNFPIEIVDESSGLTLAESIALFANARMHIGIDSFCNHLTNYLWEYPGGGRKVRGVILWGSTQASAAGYATNTNISKGPRCQPCFKENPKISRTDRGPCIAVVSDEKWGDGMYKIAPAASYDDPRPHACMDAITVEEVVEAVRKMWEETK